MTQINSIPYISNKNTQTVSNFSATNNNEVNSIFETSSTDNVNMVETVKAEKPEQANQEDRHPEATFDRQTRLYLGISEEKWNAMSENEKFEKGVSAIKQMVDSYNAENSSNKITYASQYALYAQRSSSPEEIERLASVMKYLDEENQRKAITTDINYKDPEFKNIVDRVMANDYIGYIGDNQTIAAQKIADEAIEEIKVLAAQNSTKADVKQQLGVVNALMSAENEKVDNTIASQQGQYGIDKDGNKDADVELAIFKAISNTKYESALQVAAKNISKLDEKNREAAVNVIKATNVQSAIEQISTEDVENSTASVEESYNTSNRELASALKTNDKVAIEECFKSMSTAEIAQFVSENTRSDVINQLLTLDLPQVAINIIEKNMNRSNVKVSSISLENNLSNLSSESQIKFLHQIKSEGRGLSSTKRNFLTLTAQRELDRIA